MGSNRLREVDCEICARPVDVGRDRYAEMSQTGRRPLCAQCRRALRPASEDVAAIVPGVARKSQTITGPNVVVKGLVKKQGKRAKRRRTLASYALSRIGESGSDYDGAADE